MPTITKLVDGPVSTPLPFGLLSVATVVDVDDVHEMLGVSWMDTTCGQAFTWDDECIGDESPVYPESPESPESPGAPESPFDTAKQFNRPSDRSADAINVYYGHECSTMGESFNEARSAARQGLLLGEQRALEEAVLVDILATGGDGQIPVHDLTPAGDAPLGVVQALAYLENQLAIDFGGTGVIHVPPGLSAFFSRFHLAHREGQRKITEMGHRVAFGAGYGSANIGPDGQPAPPGQAWIYATGPMIVRREPASLVPDDDSAAIDIRTNARMVLAERSFVVQVACVVEAIRVDISCCGC
ncbi:cupin [Phytoactinopolyspora mesophila]|uniref:Cupin n=1 Tax=Phytoactinopolyspora mesophila TaxID=2650750 RepID=A0A7K3M5W5_9ACTN|nr:cupin [Phytoactinopolyspora mesophila]NDL58635.1 cupin [Phytoactinopolyspora mesophila]